MSSEYDEFIEHSSTGILVKPKKGNNQRNHVHSVRYIERQHKPKKNDVIMDGVKLDEVYQLLKSSNQGVKANDFDRLYEYHLEGGDAIVSLYKSMGQRNHVKSIVFESKTKENLERILQECFK